jgi:hypothetical protein
LEDADEPSALPADRGAVDRVERLVRERDSRISGWDAELEPLDIELLLIWDERKAQHERAHQQRLEGMFEMLMTAMTTR